MPIRESKEPLPQFLPLYSISAYELTTPSFELSLHFSIWTTHLYCFVTASCTVARLQQHLHLITLEKHLKLLFVVVMALVVVSKTTFAVLTHKYDKYTPLLMMLWSHLTYFSLLSASTDWWIASYITCEKWERTKTGEIDFGIWYSLMNSIFFNETSHKHNTDT